MKWLCSFLGCCDEWKKRTTELYQEVLRREQEIAELKAQIADLTEVLENVMASLKDMGVHVDRLKGVLREWERKKLGD